MLQGMSHDLGAAHTLCTLTPSSVPRKCPNKTCRPPGRPLIRANQWPANPLPRRLHSQSFLLNVVLNVVDHQKTKLFERLAAEEGDMSSAMQRDFHQSDRDSSKIL